LVTDGDQQRRSWYMFFFQAVATADTDVALQGIAEVSPQGVTG
jgi:hypothetical protein